MKIDEVLRDVETVAVKNLELVEVGGIAYDSRDVRPGDIFAAMPGTRFDGRDFVADAITRGAVAVLTEDRGLDAAVPVVVVPDIRRALAGAAVRVYNDPSARIKVIGVTGTSGKTTVTHLVRHILDHTGNPAGLIGTVCNLVGGTAQPVRNTTPLASDIQRMLNEMAFRHEKFAVMEVSSHALVEQRVHGVRFEAAAITNITPEHLDYHETFDNYVEAKALLFDQAPKAAVFNMDDASCARIHESFKGRKAGFAIAEDADYVAHEIRLKQEKTTFRIEHRGARVAFEVGIPGHFNVQNILAAVAIAGHVGIDMGACAAALTDFSFVKGRMQAVRAGQPFSVYVDYAHKPGALKNVLQLATEVTPGRVIVVFGCGGDRDRAKRPMMGQIAEMYADAIYVTSDNPRGEDPEAIIDDIMNGITCYDKVRRITDRGAAIVAAIGEARAGDTVIVAGKGHETYQIIGNERRDFDDIKVVGAALAGLGWS